MTHSSPHDAVPSAQQAIVHRRYGPVADVLELADLPVTPPAPDEVQVRVEAAAINPIDAQLIAGDRKLISRRRFPFTPLFDLAGTVTAVGSGVSSFRIGDRVHADNEIDGGGGAEYVNVDQALLAKAPENLTIAEAAAIPLAGQTALTTLDRGQVTTGSRVAVIGASGGVGHLVIQLAKAAGAHVVGVAGARREGDVRAFGADEFVDRNVTDLSTAYGPDTFDVVIDCVGGKAQWVHAKHVLRPGGRFVTIARDEDGAVTVASALRLAATITARRVRGAGPRGFKYEPVFVKASGDLLRRVDDLASTGAVRVQVGKTFPLTLEGVRAAFAESAARRTTGKVVLTR